jgi:hypothetical protein
VPIIDYWGFRDVAFYIPPQAKTEIREIDWQWWLGELPPGEYRFQKSIMLWRNPGDFDKYTFAYNFIL